MQSRESTIRMIADHPGASNREDPVGAPAPQEARQRPSRWIAAGLIVTLTVTLYGFCKLTTWEESDPRDLSIHEAKQVAASTLVHEDDRRSAVYMIRRYVEDLVDFLHGLAAEDDGAAEEARSALELIRQLVTEPSRGDGSGK